MNSSPCEGDVAIDVRAFAAFYRSQLSFVAGAVRRCGVPTAHVEDAVQDVFIVCMRHHSELRTGEAMRGFLRAVAANVSRNHLRSLRRRSPVWRQPGEWIDPERLADVEPPMPSIATQRVLRALDKLAPDKRQVLLLAEVRQLTAREIGVMINLSPNTVSSRLRAARRDLRRAYRQAPRAGALAPGGDVHAD